MHLLEERHQSASSDLTHPMDKRQRLVEREAMTIKIQDLLSCHKPLHLKKPHTDTQNQPQLATMMVDSELLHMPEMHLSLLLEQELE